MLADLVDRHDAGVIKIGGGFGLGVEALDIRLVGELPGEDHLECDGPVQADLPGLEDDSHATPGDLADDLVVAEIADAIGFGCVECAPMDLALALVRWAARGGIGADCQMAQ